MQLPSLTHLPPNINVFSKLNDDVLIFDNMNVTRQVWEILYYFYIHLLIFNFNGLIKFKLPPIFINQIEEDKSAL
ncbi:MAG: hypothetical protein LBF40_04570, partial [Deltaproteobacteria bacterium]|nr:hypothetical protein [Deltaproteobacteria bacterium]